MIITLSGMPGSGKSSVAKALSKKLKMDHFSVGDFMREMAEKKHISLNDLSKEAEKRQDIDKQLDKWQIHLGKNNDNFVIDSRLGFHFIPKSFKVRLDGDLDVRADRIKNDTRAGEKLYASIDEAKDYIITRQNSENKRYKEYYDLDYHDEDNFDLIVDTTKLSVSEVADIIVKAVNRK